MRNLAQRLEDDILMGRGPYVDPQANAEYAERYISEIKPMLDDLRRRHPECFDQDGFLILDKLAALDFDGAQ